MSGPVKTRRYDSRRRREQASATRREILAAAQRLFERDGYTATTMAAIARDAGVALKTVYLAFETKSGVLRAVWHVLLRGERDEVPVPEQRWYLDVLAEPDPGRRIARGARNSRQVKERAGTIMNVIRSAADADSEVGGLWQRIESEFYENQRVVVQTLADDGALRPGLGVTRATDILWTLNHPDVWRLLVETRGWSPARYERWLRDTVCEQLLP